MRLLLLFLFIGSLSLKAQVTREFEVSFDNNCWLSSQATSQKFEVDIPTEADFTGLSAYVMQEDVQAGLFYRIKAGREWSEWRSFHPNTHGETPGRSAYEADPILTGFSQIQFRCSDTLDEPVIFRLYIPVQEKKSPEIALKSSVTDSCACPQPTYCDRACWCPDSNCSTGYTPTPTQPTHIIVHHSAGFSSNSDYKWVVAYYWDLHVNTNGWDDIGYNWLIDPNGVIYEARGSDVTGAHFSCMNSNTTGICMIGNYESRNPTSLSKTALKELIAWEACSHGIDVQDSSIHASSQLMLKHVSGHRDGNIAHTGCPKGTLCPGGWLYAQLPQVVVDVAGMACMQTVDLEESKMKPIVEIYPNPVGDELHLYYQGHFKTLKIIDAKGQTIMKLKHGTDIISTTQLPAGVYFLQIVGEEVILKKFLKS